MLTRARTLTAAAGTLLAFGAVCAVSAQARTSCVFAGAPTNVLTITVLGANQAVITRSGQEITISENDQPPRPCAGGIPTVSNTDTIDVLIRGSEFPDVDVLLANGPLSPGATPESTGASEIEVNIKGVVGAASVIGTRGDDIFAWAARGTDPGLNVNPSHAGDRDVDVTISNDDGVALLFAYGAAGDDRITGNPILGALVGVSASGGAGDDVLSAPKGTFAILEGGSGDDVITGSRLDDRLNGNSGQDRIAGGDGADIITGGAGSDQLFGGAGRDTVRARDRVRDKVSCGSGRDRVQADRRDRVISCEQTSRR